MEHFTIIILRLFVSHSQWFQNTTNKSFPTVRTCIEYQNTKYLDDRRWILQVCFLCKKCVCFVMLIWELDRLHTLRILKVLYQSYSHLNKAECHGVQSVAMFLFLVGRSRLFSSIGYIFSHDYSFLHRYVLTDISKYPFFSFSFFFGAVQPVIFSVYIFDYYTKLCESYHCDQFNQCCY